MAYQNTTGQVAKVMLCSWQYPVAFALDCSYIAVCDSDVYHPRKRSDMQTYYSEHRETASDNLMLSVRQSPFGDLYTFSFIIFASLRQTCCKITNKN